MKKYLLLAVLALVGCASHNYTSDYPGKSIYPEPPSPEQTVLGFNDTGDVSWSCSQAEVTPALVWDECHFYNFAADSKNVCIQLEYDVKAHETDLWTRVAGSRTICSGPMASRETKVNYAAFTSKNGRKELEELCGPNMIQCKLLAQEIKP